MHWSSRHCAITILRLSNFVASTIALLVLEPALATHPGVDNTYGSNGFASVDTGVFSPNARFDATYVAGDATGGVAVATVSDSSFAVTRLLAAGTADPGFNGGVARVVDTGIARMTALGIDAMGRTLLSGTEYDTGQTVVIVYRLTAAGALDQTFGVSGRLRTILPINVADQGVVPTQPSVLVARPGGGFFIVLGKGGVAAFNASGGLDSTFWSQGVFTTSLVQIGPHVSSYSSVLAVDGTGRIYTALPQAPIGRHLIGRVLPNGSSDGSYGGVVEAPSTGSPELAKFDAQGRMYFLNFNYFGGASYSLVRVGTDGQLDTTYGTGGYAAQTASFPYDGAVDLDVAADGRVIVAARYSNQASSAILTFRLFDASGALVPGFGGRGFTRFEQSGYGPTDVLVKRARFNLGNDRMLAFGTSSNGTGIRAVRLQLAFVHRFSASSPQAQPTSAMYGDNVQYSVTVVGDQGRPSGYLDLRLTNGTQLLCSEFVSPTGGVPEFTAGCRSDRSPTGAFTTEFQFAGDDLYVPATFPGPSAQIRRARFSLYLVPHPSLPQQPPKDSFEVGVYAFADNTSHQTIAAPVAGEFEITDGVSACRVQAAQYGYGSGGARCRIALATPGSVRLYGRHLGDPNFEVDVNGERFVVVAPPTLTRTLEDDISSTRLLATVSSGDALCGIKYAYVDAEPDPALPPAAQRAFARNGMFFVRTVDSCQAGFAGSLQVEAVAPSAPLSAAWVRDASNGWQRVAAVNQRVEVPFVDNGLNDLYPVTPAGDVALRFIPETAVRDDQCVFDVYPATADVHGRGLLMLAAGFRYSAILASLGANANRFDSWWERVSCASCQQELDLNGNGQLDIADALVLARRYAGLTPSQATANVIPDVAEVGNRSAAEAQAFIAAGCR